MDGSRLPWYPSGHDVSQLSQPRASLHRRSTGPWDPRPPKRITLLKIRKNNVIFTDIYSTAWGFESCRGPTSIVYIFVTSTCVQAVSDLCQLSRVQRGQRCSRADHCFVQLRHQFPLLCVLRTANKAQEKDQKTTSQASGESIPNVFKELSAFKQGGPLFY